MCPNRDLAWILMYVRCTVNDQILLFISLSEQVQKSWGV